MTPLQTTPILVTGAAGFIGSSVCRRLLKDGHSVVGIDNLNPYYDVSLKQARLKPLQTTAGFQFLKMDIVDRKAIEDLFSAQPFKRVIHLAAQAGVRYSVENPHAYIDSNISGFLNMLEGSRHHQIEHLIYASTSSVYGLSTRMPFSPHDDADHPVSLYGATKRANEMMAHSYSHLYQVPTTGLRFFTVYGPWGRPDMALFIFTQKILAGEPIDVFNDGKHARDFTFIDDIVEGVVQVALGTPPIANPQWNSKDADPSTSSAPFRLYNIGNNRSVELMRYIEVLEECLGKKAIKNFAPMQLGDVASTHADVNDLERDFKYRPQTSIESGIKKFVEWYRSYYGQ